MLSFWEKNSLLNYDVIIVGSGILGLSTACEIKERRPEKNVLILERGIFPTGASTKNAGFLCYGGLTEILADIELKGEDEAEGGLLKCAGSEHSEKFISRKTSQVPLVHF
ncbi:MAG: FAD-dependent oxidoreductase [Ignavibacteria bacterium]|nr:FAD-dependent oxidoreductase [Ignavibacteria bacterium]